MAFLCQAWGLETEPYSNIALSYLWRKREGKRVLLINCDRNKTGEIQKKRGGLYSNPIKWGNYHFKVIWNANIKLAAIKLHAGSHSLNVPLRVTHTHTHTWLKCNSKEDIVTIFETCTWYLQTKSLQNIMAVLKYRVAVTVIENATLSMQSSGENQHRQHQSVHPILFVQHFCL